MRSTICRDVLVCAVCVAGLSVLLPGCGKTNTPGFTRLHLSNTSEDELVYLAIEDSEMAATTAPNRLAQPLPPNTVYSAVVAHPGNYWLRTETEMNGTIVRRIEGPVRLTPGIVDWEFTANDEKPLYAAVPSTLASRVAPR